MIKFSAEEDTQLRLAVDEIVKSAADLPAERQRVLAADWRRKSAQYFKDMSQMDAEMKPFAERRRMQVLGEMAKLAAREIDEQFT